jgi:hypothetical protein
MTERMIDVFPTTQLATDDEIDALRERQEAKAQEMGELWILHPRHSIKSRKTPPLEVAT